MPHESMSKLSARPAFCTTLLNMASAVGLRQMLPGVVGLGGLGGGGEARPHGQVGVGSVCWLGWE